MALKVRGDMRGDHYLSEKHVESMVVQDSPIGKFAVAIRTVSGAEYYVNFDTQPEAERFVRRWAG